MACADPDSGALVERIAELERELAAQRCLAALVEDSPHAVVVHVDGVVRWVNHAAAALVGVDCPERYVGRSLMDFVAPTSRAVAIARIKAIMAGETGHKASETHLVGPTGRAVTVETLAAPTVWNGQPAVQLVMWDVTERRDHAARLTWDAAHDSLTRLLNRHAITGQLADLLSGDRSDDPTSLVAAMLVDLDGFKTVNDTHGHAAGDRVLTEVARHLSETAAPRHVGRLGGDEFLIVWDTTGPDEIAGLASRVAAAVVAGATFAGEAQVTASIGAALTRRGQLDADQLLARADQAMYSAKRLGGGWALEPV